MCSWKLTMILMSKLPKATLDTFCSKLKFSRLTKSFSTTIKLLIFLTWFKARSNTFNCSTLSQSKQIPAISLFTLSLLAMCQGHAKAKHELRLSGTNWRYKCYLKVVVQRSWSMLDKVGVLKQIRCFNIFAFYLVEHWRMRKPVMVSILSMRNAVANINWDPLVLLRQAEWLKCNYF